METRAHYVLIGLFTIAVACGAAGFVYWFSNLNDGGARAIYRIVFEGSVSGLRVGSAVLFNGLRVGDVTDVTIDPQNAGRVLATVSVDQQTPVQTDTKIGLTFQGLTGIASVAMQGGSGQRVTSRNGQPPTLAADPASSQDVTDAARQLLGRVDKLVVDNQAALAATLRNLEQVTGTLQSTLERNSEHIDRIVAGLDNLSGGPEGKGDIQEAAKSIRQLADNLDKRTAEITSGVNRLTASGSREITSLAADGRRTLNEIDRAVRNLDRNPQRLLFGGGNAVPEYNGRR